MSRTAALLALDDLSVGARDTVTRLSLVWGTPDNKAMWPSQKTIAERLRKHVRTVQRHLAEAVRLGVVKVWTSRARHRPDGRWVRRTNRYVLVAPRRHGCRQELSRVQKPGQAPPLRGAARPLGCPVCAIGDTEGWIADEEQRLAPCPGCHPLAQKSA